MSEPEHERAHHAITIEIVDENFALLHVETRDPALTGRQISELGQRRPPEDYYVLMRGPLGGILEVGHDQTVELQQARHFWAVPGDRLYRFFIGGIEYQWPIAPVQAATLYRLAEIDPAQQVLVLMDPDGANLKLDTGTEVDLSSPRVEHFEIRPRKHTKTIFVDDRPIAVEEDNLSGAQIKARAGIEANYQLFMEQPGDDQAITDDHTVKIVDGARFYSLPPATFG